MQAVTSKGQTPASNSPADIAKAISEINTTIATTTQTQTKNINGINNQLLSERLTFTFKNKVLGISYMTANVYGGNRDVITPYGINISGNIVTVNLICKSSSALVGAVTITAVGY